ncbi:diacylglycerol/polyprenol kinase family protein [Nafulsella turpanensis]|uniref:hypothetical protein n=1 Tax=Nafulsella turpanensis TaxID=1265690 RepID=UPI00034D23D3|nr:hypothetical protein [Nafulsella turpanensis]
MTEAFKTIQEFLQRAWPSAEQWLIFAPIAFLISLAGSRLAAWLKTKKEWRTPYTRKVFHFIIFSAASILQLWFGLPAVVVFGAVTSLFVLWAVYRGEQSPFYLALARPSDAPQQKLFILVPLLTTAAGGVLANLFFGIFASVGYLVGGWGDAVGEPVGTRWGKHRYKVPSLAGVPASRSLEGSAAVFGVAWLVAVPALLALGFPASEALWIGLACGAGGMLVEAISSHGLDNLTMQLAAAGIAWWLLG